MRSNRMLLEITSLPENVGLVRIAVAAMAAYLDFTVPELEEIKVAVSEAVSNAVIHAYPDRAGTIRVMAEVAGEDFTVTVQDDGVGIADVEQARQPSFSTDPDRMGLGFVFMESFMDEVDVESRPGEGTRVRMRKRCRFKTALTPSRPADWEA